MIRRDLALALIVTTALAGGGQSALAQACSRQGAVVTCDDGRRGEWVGNAIIWPDGTRSSSTPHPSVIIGNKSSVVVGPGVFVGQARGWCRSTTPTRRTRPAARFSMACRIAIRASSPLLVVWRRVTAVSQDEG